MAPLCLQVKCSSVDTNSIFVLGFQEKKEGESDTQKRSRKRSKKGKSGPERTE